MSDIFKHSKNILNRARASLHTNQGQSTSAAHSSNDKSSTSKPPSKTGDLGFLTIASGTDPVVDIVAIHGLQGHREKSWTTKDGTLWLRDLLPSDLPNARILSYGYDADTHSRECVSTQTMRRHADGLAKALARERKDAPRRPIIFLAHNLGGIILKWALVICHNQRLESKAELRDILISTHAILFFGTPHSGVDTTLLEAINGCASLYMKTTKAVLKDLRAHSSELENIQSLYVETSEKIKSVFFCEEYQAPINGERRRLHVPHHAAVIAGDRNATTIVLHTDHEGLVRFSAANSDDYRSVLHYLQEYFNSAATTVRENWIIEDNCRTAAKGEFAAEEVMLPKPRPSVSRSYIERKGIESQMTQKLLPEGRVKRQPRCILYGLGGAGKTQLATNWIQEHESSFSRVIFVDASSQAQLEADLQRSIRSVGQIYSKMTWEDAVAYLDGKEKGWLLFFDHADSPDLNLCQYLPESMNGTIIITTRNQDYVVVAPDGAVPVGGLEENEAIELLHTVAQLSPESDFKSREIAKELGRLAVAVTQAGVYIRRTRDLNTYLDTFREQRNRLMRRASDISKDYSSSTYTAFDLSFSQLTAKAQEFLKICAFFHHTLIPRNLFKDSTVSSFTTYTVLQSYPPPEDDQIWISELQGTFGQNWDDLAFQDVVDSASRVSLIDISTDVGSFYNIHPLLQMYIKDTLTEQGVQRYQRMATQLMLGAIRPSQGNNTWHWQLRPHANAVAQPVLLRMDAAHALAFNELYTSLDDWQACHRLLGSVFIRLTHYGIAVCLTRQKIVQRKLLAIHLEEFGQKDQRTLVVMRSLANTLQSSGRLGEAEALQREALSLHMEVLGPEHEATIEVKASLGITLRSRGQPHEAETIQREVLATLRETLDNRNLRSVSAMGNLANTLAELGQLDEAEEMARTVHTLNAEILGPQHPDTFAAMINLGIILTRIGRLDEAGTMLREVLAFRRETFGERHPDTLMAKANLANTLVQSRQFDKAIEIEREVLAVRSDIFGLRNPETLHVSYNLAQILYSSGQLEEAAKLLDEGMEVRTQILGEDHPLTRDAKALRERITEKLWLMQNPNHPVTLLLKGSI
ncbi:related to kinesin light chain [Serendipita indica DSM 11827]|uniref:Related to kinesin light chain n=1 Tax=Serendipita indica (strain DSM 11827) TaxID=1109443 RepID=G4TTB2_SERID|nr:related to kinesin light chain [Serendipita indica DSM 11827]